MSSDDPIWVTADGREIPLSEMHAPHIGNARVRIKDWAKGERDPAKRRELRQWVSRFGKEARRRQKEWLLKRRRSDAEA